MSSAEKVVPIAVSVVIIVLVALVQERSREVAAIVAVMPITMPLAAWIVFSSSGGDHLETSRFVGSMLSAYLPTVVFVAAFWVGLRQGWPFALTLVAAFAVWAVLVALPHLLRRIL
jgi:uncharacterized membrane protein (GlpM family)